MHTISNNSTSCSFFIKTQDGYIPQFHSPDIKEELDLIGTDRTIINLYGFGSPEVEYEIMLTEQDYEKLKTIRAAQTATNTIRLDGSQDRYALSFSSPPRKLWNEYRYAIWMTIRLKRI